MNSKSKSIGGHKLTSLYLSLGLIIVVFYTSFNDPFNVAKQIALYISSVYFLFELLSYRKIFNKILDRRFFLIISVYAVSLCVATIFTRPTYIALFGDNLRKNGLLTYLSFLIIFLYIVLKFNVKEIPNFYGFMFILNIFVSGYGLLQVFKLDFVSWSKSAGIIGTLGNSNFAGVVYAFLSLFSLGAIFYFHKTYLKVIAFFNLNISIICLLNTNARQSILIFLVGTFVLTYSFLNKLNKILKSIYLGIIAFSSVFVVLGIFKVGPLAPSLYKDSIGVRIFYWKAAWKMFLSHPLLGVGMDRYGAYFKEFRESAYPLKYGYELTSTNAHNVFLQIFSTTGIFSGIAYIALISLIFLSAINLIKGTQGKSRFFFINVFAVWIAFQLQSLVSIDNIGVAIFNWITSGIIVSGYCQVKKENQSLAINYQINKSAKKVLVRPLFIVPVILLCTFFARSESNYLILRNSFNPANPDTKSAYVAFANNAINSPLVDPAYKTAVANSLLDYKEYSLGKKILDESYKTDHRDLSALWGLALLSELQSNYLDAIKYRNLIAQFDPWNAKNYVQLLYDYSTLGDKQAASKILERIEYFASNTDEAKKARQLLNSLN